MCQCFEKRGYPVSVVKAGHHRAQQFDRQSALQTSQKDKNDRIPFTLTFHPHNHAVKSIIFNNLKLLQSDPETGRIFSQPPLISFKSDKYVGNFLVRSALKTNEQPGTFKCARSRCKTTTPNYRHGYLRPFPTSRYGGKLQEPGTKIHLPNRYPQSTRY